MSKSNKRDMLELAVLVGALGLYLIFDARFILGFAYAIGSAHLISLILKGKKNGKK